MLVITAMMTDLNKSDLSLLNDNIVFEESFISLGEETVLLL